MWGIYLSCFIPWLQKLWEIPPPFKALERKYCVGRRAVGWREQVFSAASKTSSSWTNQWSWVVSGLPDMIVGSCHHGIYSSSSPGQWPALNMPPSPQTHPQAYSNDIVTTLTQQQSSLLFSCIIPEIIFIYFK